MATYYVSPSGNDANAGTSGSRWRTFAHAASVAVAGDTVIFGDGTYGNEGVTGSGYVVSLSNSGSSGSPITFQAENPRAAILNSGDGSNGGSAYAYINLNNASYIVIDGFVLQNSNSEGFHNNGAAHHITIKNNTIRYIANIAATDSYGRDGIYCALATHDLVFDGNIWHDIGRSNTSYTSSLDHAIYFHSQNVQIINNTFYNQYTGWDIQIADGANNVLIANNVFASHNPSQSGQIMVWDSHSGLTIKNNIFYNPPGYAVTHYTESVSSSIFDYNLISNTAGAYGGSGITIGANNLFNVDPLFTDPANHDYTLQASSPAIDAGTTVSAAATDGLGNSRPSGAGYDIGAYEYAGSATLPAIISLTASPASITSGSTTLNWSVIRDTSLSIDNGVGTVTGTSSVSVSPSVTTTYTLTATNGTGSVTRAVTVTVAPAGSSPAILSLASSTPTFSAGQPVTLSFSFANATTASIDNGVGSVAGLSSVVVFPNQTTTYTLTVGSTGPGSASQSVTVALSPVPSGAVGENIRVHQIRRAERHGARQILQASDGTGIVRHLAGFLIDGSLTDSGIDAAELIAILSATRQAFFSYFLAGKPDAGATAYLPIPGNMTSFEIPANFSGAKGGCVNPTATAVYTFYKNGSSFGTASISTGGVFTWATSGVAVTFAPGSDEISWSAPGTQDATLSNVRFAVPLVIS